MNLLSFILARGLYRTSLEIALDLIYAATGLQFPADKITLGEPSEVDPRPFDEEDPNTFVTAVVNEVIDDRYNGLPDDGFLYRRIPLSWIVPVEINNFDQPENLPYTTHQILNRINFKLGTQLTEDDVLNETVTSLQFELTIKANPKSLVWLGERTLTFQGLSQGRLLENNSYRITEDGKVRIAER